MVLVFNAYLINTRAFTSVNFCAVSSEGVAELDFGEVGDLRIDADALLATGVGSKSERGVGEGVGEAAMGNAKTVGRRFGDGATQGAGARLKGNDLHVQHLAEGIVVEHALNNFFGAFHGFINQRKKRCL
ncbi:MAG: hypothetical protein RL762_932 [Bacteroidota bacterium]